MKHKSSLCKLKMGNIIGINRLGFVRHKKASYRSESLGCRELWGKAGGRVWQRGRMKGEALGGGVAHLGRGCGQEGEVAPGEPRWAGDEDGESIRGLSSPVWRRQSSSSLLRLSRFFSLLSFSTCSCRLAFSSESCLQPRQGSVQNSSLYTLVQVNRHNFNISTFQ